MKLRYRFGALTEKPYSRSLIHAGAPLYRTYIL